MKRYIGAIAFIIISPIVFTFQGCGPDCEPLNLIIRDFETSPVKMIAVDSGVVSWDRIEEFAHTPRHDSLALLINLLFKEVSSIEGSISYGMNACEPVVIYLDELVDIHIFSDQDYDQDHPKESDLNSLCAFGANNDQPMLNKDDFIELINVSSLSSHHFLIAFAAPPDHTNAHNITIELELKSGETHRNQIEGLVISK